MCGEAKDSSFAEHSVMSGAGFFLNGFFASKDYQIFFNKIVRFLIIGRQAQCSAHWWRGVRGLVPKIGNILHDLAKEMGSTSPSKRAKYFVDIDRYVTIIDERNINAEDGIIMALGFHGD